MEHERWIARLRRAERAMSIICSMLMAAAAVTLALVLHAHNTVPGWNPRADPVEHWIAVCVALLLFERALTRK